jgi:hypothetical protein
MQVWFGVAHHLEDGNKWYVNALMDPANYKSSVFYNSGKGTAIGPMVDQVIFTDNFINETYQDNAYESIHSFIKE